MVIVEGEGFKVINLGGSDGCLLEYWPFSEEKEDHFLEHVGVEFVLIQVTEFEFNPTLIGFNPEDVNKVLRYFGNKYTIK